MCSATLPSGHCSIGNRCYKKDDTNPESQYSQCQVYFRFSEVLTIQCKLNCRSTLRFATLVSLLLSGPFSQVTASLTVGATEKMIKIPRADTRNARYINFVVSAIFSRAKNCRSTSRLAILTSLLSNGRRLAAASPATTTISARILISARRVVCALAWKCPSNVGRRR